MFSKSFNSALDDIVEFAPDCSNPTKVLAWTKVASDVLSAVYKHLDADEIETQLIEAIKERDGYEDDEDDEE